jgi:hypothetical protein
VLRTFLWGDITHRCNVAAYLLKGVLLHDHTVLICIREVVRKEKFLKSRRKEEIYILSLSRTELCNSKCPGAGHGGDSSRRSHYHSPSRSPLLPYARTHLYIACIHVRTGSCCNLYKMETKIYSVISFYLCMNVMLSALHFEK